MENYFDFKDQVVLITGATNGVGLQMAKALSSYGATTVLVAKKPDLIEKNAADIEKEYGVTSCGIACEITDTDQVNNLIDQVLQRFGRIDILINNVGIGAVVAAEDMDDQIFQRELDVGLTATFKLCRAVAKKAMLPAKYGRIINVSSVYGLVGNKITQTAGYHAAKGAVINLTRGLAGEWGNRGITVNSICPGYFYTPLTKETLESDYFKNFANFAVPLERYGYEDEANTAILFLASKASSYINGVCIPVDGGYTAL